MVVRRIGRPRIRVDLFHHIARLRLPIERYLRSEPGGSDRGVSAGTTPVHSRPGMVANFGNTDTRPPGYSSLVTAYPLDNRYNVMTWAWWGPGLFWIGPRHTNYPDGSVCSYEIRDGTWNRQMALTTLLDLHVVWVVRHIFMRWFGYWPGHQVFHTSYERLNEHRPGELCGGCDSGLRYEECCQKLDEENDGVESVALSVIKLSSGIERKPPKPIRDFVYGQLKAPPLINDLSPSPVL